MSLAPARPKSSDDAALVPGSTAAAARNNRGRQWNVAGKLGRFAGERTWRAALFIGLMAALLMAPYLYLFGERAAAERRTVSGSNGLANLELRSLDARFAARGIVVPPSADKIAIVGIDQNSLGVVGQWPWPRRVHARLIDRLKAAGARVIAIDADFSDRQRPGKNGQLSADDRALIEAAGRAGNVVLPSLLVPEIGANNARAYHLAAPFGADENGNAGLDEQTLDLGLAYVPEDGDGRVRSYPFALDINGETLGGLAPLSCAIYQGLLTAKGSARYAAALKSGAWPTLAGQSVGVPASAQRLAGASALRWKIMPLNFAGPGGTFPTYGCADVLSGYDKAQMKSKFGGRIVLIGATTPVLKDVFAAPPFESKSGLGDILPGTKLRDEGTSATIPGVELHATAIAMLLDGNYLAPPLAWLSWVSLFGMALSCALWAERARERVSRSARALQAKWSARGRRGRIYDAAWFALYSLVLALPLGAFWLVCTLAFRAGHLWMTAVYPMGAGLGAGAATLIFLFTLESSARRKVVGQLGLYMDNRVVEEILAHPEEEYPRPRRTQATVLFTDIEGFTAFSEAHEAEEVVAALNAFFTRMKPIVVAHGGSIDKFVGDAMMCFFGVPLPRADHARRALQCALALQEECARFRHQTGIPFRMRIGLHTGPLIVGSVGSEAAAGASAHMNYTVIGDTVNLASRLEAKNKEFGSWILCSRALGEAAPGVANFVAARTPIKGLREEVEVLIAIGDAHRDPRARVWAARTPEEIERAEVAIAQGVAQGEQTPELAPHTRALPAVSEPVSGEQGQSRGRIFESE